ncbi:MAG: hypothetical protein R3Y53_02865 [Bacillota bacterium]
MRTCKRATTGRPYILILRAFCRGDLWSPVRESVAIWKYLIGTTIQLLESWCK